ncbi:MAG: secondary thiamine-phosphate synthase enzyme YjbQ [Clostridiales bacterium]|jgi:secondary thiamine-phosphate synthase enzyme|nr:secondary thiamine-phosphate synthase enzyme YjbQ [Clostridiales bacterium]
MIYEYSLSAQRKDFYNITPQVREAVAKSGVSDGVAIAFCPHTTAGITINENADPGCMSEQDAKHPTSLDVVSDLLLGLDKAFPDRPEFSHAEGNSAAHLKASAMGSSVTIIIDGGKLVLGTWQGIYFTEFDPPRNRKFYVKVAGT